MGIYGFVKISLIMEVASSTFLERRGMRGEG
jgi:hypothetical protein